MKTSSVVVFGLAALIQWAAPVMQIWKHESVLTGGTLVKIKCGAPDPYDPLRGRFLAVRPEQDMVTVPSGAAYSSGQTVYGWLDVGSDGLATVTKLSETLPIDHLAIELTTSYSYDGKVYITWPFDRFYLNEKIAPEADVWLRDNLRDRKTVVAEVRVKDGRAVLQTLSLDGKSFRDILAERVGH